MLIATFELVSLPESDKGDSEMENRIYDLLGIQNKNDLHTVAKRLNIKVPVLRAYAQNMDIPIGKDAQAIQEYLGISPLVYKLKFGDCDSTIKKSIMDHAEEIASIISKDKNNEIEIVDNNNPVQSFKTNLGKMFRGDGVKLMKSLKDESVDMIFADPPFNLGKKYESRIDDKLSNETYLRWTESWVQEATRILKPGGSIFVWNYPKWNIKIAEMLERHLTLRHWITVNMKYGFPISGKLYPAHYALLYFIKGNRPSTFHPCRIPMSVCPTCGHELKDYGGYKMKMNPRGINLSDVWDDIYPVRHSKYKNRNSNELPIKLLDRLISMSTDENDVILDPFGGSGTTYAVAEMLKRKWIGCEIGPVQQIHRRMANLQGEKVLLDKIHSEENKLFLPKTVSLRKKNGFWLPEDFTRIHAREGR